MSREWVDDAKRKPVDRRWIMRCDAGLFSGTRKRCETVSEPSWSQPPLWHFVMDGWFIAAKHGDICPACIAEGYKPTDDPHPLMLAFAGVGNTPDFGTSD